MQLKCERGLYNYVKGEYNILDSKEKALEIADLAEEKHAKDIVIIDIGKLSSIAEYLVICSGMSDRQVQTIAYNIHENLKNNSLPPLSMEGANEGRWIIIDYGDVVVHIFMEGVREFYDLEGLWADAPRIELDDIFKRG